MIKQKSFSGSLKIMLCTLFLSACVSHTNYVPPQLPQGETRWFQVEEFEGNDIVQTSVLAVQGLHNGNTRWILSDPFGVPQARMIATQNGWEKDGFAPPNRTAKRLFVRLFPLIEKSFRQPEIIEINQKQWRISIIETQI